MTNSVSTQKWPPRGVFDLAILEERPGFLLFRATGRDAQAAFKNEGGGHRWQRCPKNDKRGRVHTSTVTVAVLEEATEAQMHVDLQDIEIRTCRGSGAGGQHRNVTDSAVQVLHKPSGILVRCEGERSQHQNKEGALRVLRARLLQHAKEGARQERASSRKSQVGSGQRGDKIRTIAVQRDQVTDHRTGKQTTVRDYRRGMFDGVW